MKKLTAQNRVFGGVFCLILFSSIVEAQETVITTSEEPVVVIDSYEAALDGNGKSDLKIGEAVEPDFFNDIVDRIRGIFTNDDGSIEIGFLSGVFKSDTPALKIDAEGDAIFRGDLTARTIKSAGDLTVGSPEEPSKTEGKAITVGDKDRGVIELHGGDGQDIIAKGIVQMGDFGMELGTLTNQILKFFTNSTPRMSITSDGNVGIGTTSPGAKLEVVRNDADANIANFIGNRSNGAAWVTFQNDYSDDSDHIFGIGIDNNQKLNFSPMGGLGIGMDVDGNVGIGTTDPGAKLEVVGESRFKGIRFNPNGQNFEIDKDANDRVIFAFNKSGTREWSLYHRASGSLEYKKDSGTGGFFINGAGLGVISGSAVTSLTASDGSLELESANDGYAFIDFKGDENLDKDYSGRLGYNDDSDTFSLNKKLTVSGSVTASSFIGDGSQLTGIEGKFTDGDTATDAVFTAGNVGIGTTSPGSYRLKVHRGDSSSWTARFSNNAGWIDIGPANASWAHIYTDRPKFIFNRPVYSVDDTFSSYDNDLKLQTAGTTRIFVEKDNGNVGIGTTSPGAKLEVNGSILIPSKNFGGDYVTDNANVSNSIIFGNASTETFQIFKQNSGEKASYCGSDNWHDCYIFLMTDSNGGDPDGAVIFGGLGNDDVFESYLKISGGGNVVVSDSITASSFIGDGSQLTNIPSSSHSHTHYDIVSEGSNRWIFHTPDDNRRTLYIAPFTDNRWDWGNQTTIDNSGNMVVNGSITASSFIGDGSQLTNLPVTDYSLPEASATALGGIKVGSNLSISNGVLSATDTNTQLTEDDVDEMVDDNGYLTSYTETDPNVNLLGKTSLSCKDGEIPKYDRYVVSRNSWNRSTTYGYRWICSSDNNTWRSISSVTDSTSTTTAASLSAVKKAYDKGNHSHPYLSTSGGTVSGSITATSFLYSSDENKKKDIQTLGSPLETIQNLRGVSFRWQENDEESIGFIAQEVEKVLPSLVSGENGEKSVAYGNITAVLVEAVKELSAQNKALQERVEALESL